MRFCPTCGLRFADDVTFCPEDGAETLPLEDDDNPLVGQVIDGRYRIEHQIGEGGMGIVYSAIHTVLNKRLALKVLRGDMSKNAETVQRFIQEAQAASAIGHQNIIDINDFGRLPDGSAYFVMEHLEGQPLNELIARGGSVPMQDAIDILLQIASALGAAHRRGIVHRDLKPDNVFLIQRGGKPNFVKVLDFGIAKVGGAASKLTKTGMIFGTPQYMSPEQAAGQAVDARTDIYALGVIMYEMFTGHVPFDADTFMGILSKHMFEPPAPPSTANPQLGALEDVILKALAKKPEDRHGSVEALADELKGFSAEGAITLGRRTAGLADALEPPSRTEANLAMAVPKTQVPWWLVVGGAGALLATLAAVAVLVIGSGSTPLDASLSAGAAAGTPSGQTSVASAQVQPTAAPDDESTPRGADGSDDHKAGAAADNPEANHDRPANPAIAGGKGTAAQEKTVEILSVPPRAQVLEDGVFLGNTPLSLVMRSGDAPRDLELRLPGHRPEQLEISGATPTTTVTLTAARTRRARRRSASPHTMNTPPPAMQAPTPTRQRPRLPSEVVDPWAL